MRAIETMILAGVTFVAAACGPAATTTQAQAQPTAPTQTAATPAPTAPPANAPATAADKAGILRAMQLSANARGLVMNECNDRVEPQYIPADVGLGRTILFVMAGGPNGGYSCYGDGPGLWLMRQEGAAWRAIYQSRGGYMAIMPSLHRGAHDLVFAGPGFTHPSSRWDGHDYVGGPDVSDEAVSHGVTLPAG